MGFLMESGTFGIIETWLLESTLKISSRLDIRNPVKKGGILHLQVGVLEDIWGS